MIEILSSWAENVVLAIIITTIIELIIPNNKNKKYIQMVIGVYILFNIISPIVNNKEKFLIEEASIEKYINKSNINVNESSIDEKTENIYLEELKKNITARFEDKGVNVYKCEINAELDSSKKNSGIHNIMIKVNKKNINENEISKIKSELAKDFEIEEDKISIIIN